METVKVSLAIGQVTIAEECVGYAASLSTKKLCYLRYKVYDKSELTSFEEVRVAAIIVVCASAFLPPCQSRWSPESSGPAVCSGVWRAMSSATRLQDM